VSSYSHEIQRKEKGDLREREIEREGSPCLSGTALLSARKNVLVGLWGGFMRRLTL